MKERPILFAAPMVRAILEGRKTQTRRVVRFDVNARGKDAGVCAKMLYDLDHAYKDRGFPDADGAYRYEYLHVPYAHPNDGWEYGAVWRLCPRWDPGDRLWVKEKWRPVWHADLCCSVQYAADSSYRKPEITNTDRGHRFADMCEQSGDHAEPWHPSIHMWREMSRLTLEVVGVRVERLQKITPADAEAEGVDGLTIDGNEYAIRTRSDAVLGYSQLWESINGAGSWDANPWVWVVEFKRVEQMQELSR